MFGAPGKSRLPCNESQTDLLVDLEAYPDYLEIVGGEDKMMDLGTIQGKIDNEEYRSIDEFQASQSH